MPARAQLPAFEVLSSPEQAAAVLHPDRRRVLEALREHGIEHAEIRRVLSPPWTTDWISEEGREKLREYGIAPPQEGAGKRALLGANLDVACPRCGATATERVSEFGSTACKAAYRCRECLEPFEYFKCI